MRDLFSILDITRVPKPWGYELIFAKTERYVGKILHIDDARLQKSGLRHVGGPDL